MAFQAIGDPAGGNGSAEQLSTARDEFRAHWKVVLASFVGLTFGAWSLPYYLLGPLIKPLEAGLGWARADIVYCAAFIAIGSTLGNPLIGFIVDRYQPRVAALGSLLAVALGLGAIGLLEGDVIQLQLIYLAIGLLGAGSGGVSFTRAIGTWFRKGRGMALGIALCGTGAAAFIAPLLAQSLIDLVGWRQACGLIGALIAFVGIPVVAWGLRTPIVGELPATAPPPDLRGMRRGQAMRDSRFYVLGLSVGIFGLFASAIGINLVPMFIDKGIPAARAAQWASLIGISMIVGRLTIGWLLDRMPPALLGAIIFFIGAAGAFSFVMGGTAAALVMVVTAGFLVGAELDLLAYLSLRYFGPRNSGAIFGMLFAFYTLFAMAAPAVNARLLAAGGYDAMFIATGIAFLSSGLLFLGLFLARRDEAMPDH